MDENKEWNTHIEKWFTSYTEKYLEPSFYKTTLLAMLYVVFIVLLFVNDDATSIDWLNTLLSIFFNAVLFMCLYMTLRRFARKKKLITNIPTTKKLALNDLEKMLNDGATINMNDKMPHKGTLRVLVNDQALELRESTSMNPKSDLGWCWYDLKRKREYSIPMTEQAIATLRQNPLAKA